jgi:hypothetical protein
MPTLTKTPIACECGHSGLLVRSETVQASGISWATYKLQGFTGSYGQGSAMEPKNVLPLLKPLCPKCGATGRVAEM